MYSFEDLINDKYIFEVVFFFNFVLNFVKEYR